MALIMIVDDNRHNHYLMGSILRASGHEVIPVYNGAEALAVARQNRPDLIIADIFMPVMDGFTLCREWKADERLKSIPFVFYTARYTSPKDEQFALSLGAERFLTKPQQARVLMEIVQKLLDENTVSSRSM